jgi:RNA-binding protein
VELTGKQLRHLRALAHHLKPVVLTGNSGVTDAVIEKIVVELENHELIKVRVADGPEHARDAAASVAERTDSVLVQVIGKVVILYKRRKKDPEIVIPRD